MPKRKTSKQKKPRVSKKRRGVDAKPEDITDAYDDITLELPSSDYDAWDPTDLAQLIDDVTEELKSPPPPEDDAQDGDASDVDEPIEGVGKINEKRHKVISYDRKLYPKIQKEKWKYHLTEKSLGVGKKGSGKFVPPRDDKWPTRRFSSIKNLADFLDVINHYCTHIIASEVAIENDAVMTAFPNKYFQNKQMQWNGWSGMLQLEKTFPDVMDSCQGFFQCLHTLFKHELKKGVTHLYVLIVFKRLQNVIHLAFASVGAVRASTVENITRKFIKIYKKSKTWAESSEQHKASFAQNPPLVVPEFAQIALKKAGGDRLTSYLTNPDIIFESELVEGIKNLVRTIWGVEMDTSKPVNLENQHDGVLSNKFMASACLLELMCGSRLFGVLCVNWMSQLTSGTLDEWSLTHDGRRNPYNAWRRCIVVNRLSKEGTKSEMGIRTIVKPLITAFIDPAFLNPRSGSPLEDDAGVEIFLNLFKHLRRYVFSHTHALNYNLRAEQQDGVWGLDTAQVTNLPDKGRTWMNNTTTKIVRFARSVFPDDFFKHNQGTHLFRKIYVNWAYEAFARDHMKETGFASEVLGHRGFQVSLNYTALIIKRVVMGSESRIHEVENKFTDVLKRLDLLEKRQPEEKAPAPQVDPDEVVLDGVRIKKLPKSAYGQNAAYHQERGLWKISEMQDLGISTTVRNQRAVGINVTLFKQ